MKNNKVWAISRPLISIIIPNYNRKDEFLRAFNSVCNIKPSIPFEVIIVDDGSSINLAYEYNYCLSFESFPVCLLEKENGGVHTARNKGVSIARGEYCIFLDSDDEILPNAFTLFLDELNKIPEGKKQSIFEVKFRCKNQNGEAISKELNSKINMMPKQKQMHLISKCGEMIGIRKTVILKNNLFPEPNGITFVMENILWDYLKATYDSWYSNSIIRIYHTETDQKLTSVKRKNGQHCKNRCWNYCYLLNNSNIYQRETKNRVKCVFIYSMFKSLVKKTNTAENGISLKLTKRVDRLLEYLIKPLAIIASKIYYKKYFN